MREPHTSDPSVLLYGLHTALLLLDGLGQEELAPAYDPRPASHGFHRRRSDGDPFEDPTRPLRLTLATDCKWLDRRVYEDLLKLGALPYVTLDLAPGLPSHGYENLSTTTATVRRDGAIDHVDITTEREPNTTSSGVLVGGGEGALRRLLGLSDASARRLSIDVAIHEGLGNDYLISETAIEARRHRRAGWPNQLGACSVSEAFRLAGTKARMYEDVPIEIFPPSSSMSVNVGRWRDQAAMWSAWAVRRALAGTLNPRAAPEEQASQSHLLAMRSLLVDALVARDFVYRLTRRHAAKRERRTFASEPAAGARGNDLLQLMRYHTVSMLDHVFALTDNLAWVAVRRTGTFVRAEHEVGLGALVGPRKRPWARAGALGAISTHLEASPELAFLLAARRIRNASIHQEGVPYGAVHFEPRPSPPLEVAFAIWLDEQWDAPVLREIGARAEFSKDGIVVITFLRLVDEIWRSVTAFLNHVLAKFSWSSVDWARADPSYRDAARFDMPWSSRRHPLLFGFRET